MVSVDSSIWSLLLLLLLRRSQLIKLSLSFWGQFLCVTHTSFYLSPSLCVYVVGRVFFPKKNHMCIKSYFKRTFFPLSLLLLLLLFHIIFMTVFYSLFSLLQNSNSGIPSGIVRSNLHEVDGNKEDKIEHLRRRRARARENKIEDHPIPLTILCITLLWMCAFDHLIFGDRRVLQNHQHRKLLKE